VTRTCLAIFSHKLPASLHDITLQKGVMPLCERPYSRMAFVMDYRDSELFHLLEDTVRRQVSMRPSNLGSTKYE